MKIQKELYRCEYCGQGITTGNVTVHGSQHLSIEDRKECERLAHEEVNKMDIDWDGVSTMEAREMLMVAFRKNVKRMYDEQETR